MMSQPNILTEHQDKKNQTYTTMLVFKFNKKKKTGSFSKLYNLIIKKYFLQSRLNKFLERASHDNGILLFR